MVTCSHAWQRAAVTEADLEEMEVQSRLNKPFWFFANRV